MPGSSEQACCTDQFSRPRLSTALASSVNPNKQRQVGGCQKKGPGRLESQLAWVSTSVEGAENKLKLNILQLLVGCVLAGGQTAAVVAGVGRKRSPLPASQPCLD